ncbi:MAG: urea ABC transporter ATP-binding subunit UrtE [Pseudomonadota bacterium]
MLDLKNIELHYGSSKVLHGVDLSAEKGRVTCVMGVNGAGKTSLLKVIAGAHPRSSGDYVLDGAAQDRPSSAKLARVGVAYVPQGREIFPLLTVRENLETGYACLDKSARRVPDEIFDLFPVLKEMENRRGGDLSGGQQQQLAIGRALVTKPKVLLLDEPTEGIQPNIIQQISRVIAHLRDQGEMAIVLVEQYFDFAVGLADQIVALRGGHVALSGASGELSRDDLMKAVSV